MKTVNLQRNEYDDYLISDNKPFDHREAGSRAPRKIKTSLFSGKQTLCV